MNTRQFSSLVQRELWENRSLYIAPAATAVLFLLGFLIGAARLPPDTLNSAQHYDLVSLLIMGVTMVVAVFYCVDALYGERRDRSILFWKSLPVSDVTTVLSKMSIPVVVLPLVGFSVTVATHLAMLLLSSAMLSASGAGAAAVWSHLGMFHMWRTLFVHLVTGHGLWYAPFYAWLLLVSAWARRAPFLWAVLPPFVIGGVEKIAFNTSHFAAMLLYRMAGGPQPIEPAPAMSMDAMTPYTVGQILDSPGFWIGLLIAAAFLAGAVRLRRYRSPI